MSEKWEEYARDTYRLAILGGWLYKVRTGFDPDGTPQFQIVFVPNPPTMGISS